MVFWVRLLFPCLLLGGAAWHTLSLGGGVFSLSFLEGAAFLPPPFSGASLSLFFCYVVLLGLFLWVFSLLLLRAAAFLLLLWVGRFSLLFCWVVLLGVLQFWGGWVVRCCVLGRVLGGWIVRWVGCLVVGCWVSFGWVSVWVLFG